MNPKIELMGFNMNEILKDHGLGMQPSSRHDHSSDMHFSFCFVTSRPPYGPIVTLGFPQKPRF